jgi:hypothetical protein
VALLSEIEFAAMFAPPMRDVTATAEPPCDIWAYVATLPPPDLGALELGDVAYVYRDGRDAYDHVLIDTNTPETFLVVVIDLRDKAVAGHHLLDLKALYSLKPA